MCDYKSRELGVRHLDTYARLKTTQQEVSTIIRYDQDPIIFLINNKVSGLMTQGNRMMHV